MAAWCKLPSLMAVALLCMAWPELGQAASVPRGFAFEALADNGRSFITGGATVPLRCLDAPGLLNLPVEEQGETLNKAVSAGFNAISFEAPLFGQQGLAKTLGKVDAAQGDNFTRLLQACAKRRLYAFPVLWTPAAADALIGTQNAKVAFWGGKNSLGWQVWVTKELAKLKVEGMPITRSAAVGGWLLYRGPWPGGEPKQGAVMEARTPTTEAWMRSWAQSQVKMYRKLGFSQRLGMGLWAKQDFAATVEPKAADESDKPAAPVIDAAPFAPLSTDEKKVDTSLEHAKALDALPTVPGMEALLDEAEFLEAEESGPAQAQTPWDLEGLDWDRVESFFATAPMSTQLDFFEFSLETQDWYRVGDRLAEAALKAEVPVLWRQDWRTASRYERAKRLDPPPPLAGLIGPWPDEDWPAEGESIWPPKSPGAVEALPFKFKQTKLKKKGKLIYLEAELNKPAELIVRWGKGYPFNQEVRSKGRSKAEHSLLMVGAQPGQWLLVQVKADSQRSGSALSRARWIRAPK